MGPFRGLQNMTYSELANRCREIHAHVSMLAQVQGERELEDKLKERIATDWQALAQAYNSLNEGA